MNTGTIRNAIANRQIVEFSYKGYHRIAEPHIYGIKDDKRQILVYQIGGGSSSGRIPDWRRMDIDKIEGLKTTGQTFAGPRETPSGDHSEWDTIIAIVS